MGKVILCLFLLAGCSFKGQASATAGAAAEVLPQRAIPATASVYLSSELSGLSRTVSPSYVCGAHAYPLSLGAAIQTSIITTNEAAFDAVVSGKAATSPEPGALRHIAFDLEQMSARLEFSPGFFTANAQANVDLIMGVSVYDAAGTQILRAVVQGNGFAEQQGDCPSGSSVLGRAATTAIERALEEYVFKVINADQIGLTEDELAIGS